MAQCISCIFEKEFHNWVIFIPPPLYHSKTITIRLRKLNFGKINNGFSVHNGRIFFLIPSLLWDANPHTHLSPYSKIPREYKTEIWHSNYCYLADIH